MNSISKEWLQKNSGEGAKMEQVNSSNLFIMSATTFIFGIFITTKDQLVQAYTVHSTLTMSVGAGELWEPSPRVPLQGTLSFLLFGQAELTKKPAQSSNFPSQ